MGKLIYDIIFMNVISRKHNIEVKRNMNTTYELDSVLESLTETINDIQNNNVEFTMESFMAMEEVLPAFESKESVKAEKDTVRNWIKTQLNPEMERYSKGIRAEKKNGPEAVVKFMEDHAKNMKTLLNNLKKIKVENNPEDKLREAKNLSRTFTIIFGASSVIGAILAWLTKDYNSPGTGALHGTGLGMTTGVLYAPVFGGEWATINKMMNRLKAGDKEVEKEIEEGKTSAQQYKDKTVNMIYEYISKLDRAIEKAKQKIK